MVRSDCRKPLPGLLLRAAEKYGIDLSRSFMIGDRWRDVGASGLHVRDAAPEDAYLDLDARTLRR